MISLHTEIESVSLQIAEKTIVWWFEQMQSSIPLKWLWYCPGIIAARFCHNKDDLPMKWSVATRASSHARVTSVKSQQHLIFSEWMSDWLTDKARQWSDLGPIKSTIFKTWGGRRGDTRRVFTEVLVVVAGRQFTCKLQFWIDLSKRNSWKTFLSYVYNAMSHPPLC